MNIINKWLNWTRSLFTSQQQQTLEHYKDFFDTIEKHPLTLQQRQAIIADQKRALIIAGAGTGKTSVIVGKIGYLLKSGLCTPDELLIIAYGERAAKELSRRIDRSIKELVTDQTYQTEVGIVSTFQALGTKILLEGGCSRQVAEFTNQEDNLQDFFDLILDKLLVDEKFKSAYAQYFEQHEYPEDIDGQSFKSTAEFAHWIQTLGGLQALNGENTKSNGEVLIANFLLRHGISYTYERYYKPRHKIKFRSNYRPAFYLDESGIYIEYFVIDKNGETANHIDHTKYTQEMAKIQDMHTQGRTTLISLYYHQLQDKTLLNKLYEELINQHVNLRHQPDEVVLEKVIERKKHRRFQHTFNSFLGLYKESIPAANIDDFIASASASESEHNYQLLNIFKQFINSYNDELLKIHEIDLSDTISESTQLVKDKKYSVGWKYIIIDEFQDISSQRYGLIKAILEQNQECKLFCAGDDWQGAYKFSGCDRRLLTDFEKYFGTPTLLGLEQSFRLGNQVAKVGESFVLKNKRQLKKKLKAKTNESAAQVLVHWHLQEQNFALSDALDNIYQEFENTHEKTLLLLFRYQASMRSVIASDMFDELPQYWASVDRKTIYNAKAREADFVIVADISGDVKGFPYESIDDQVMDYVLPEQDDFPHSEERRLFYIALTRAKEQVHLLADSNSPSGFAQEICEHESVQSFGDQTHTHICPVCAANNKNGTLRKRINRDGKTFFLCSNKPFCKFQPFVCTTCYAGMVVRDRSQAQRPAKASCQNRACGEQYEACGCCDYGILRDKVGNYGPFKACCLYRQTGCRNTINPKNNNNNINGYGRERSGSRNDRRARR